MLSTEEGTACSNPDEYIRKRARDGVSLYSHQPLNTGPWEDFFRSDRLDPGSFGNAGANQKLKARLDSVDHQFGFPVSRLYYLAVQPSRVPTSVAREEPCPKV